MRPAMVPFDVAWDDLVPAPLGPRPVRQAVPARTSSTSPLAVSWVLARAGTLSVLLIVLGIGVLTPGRQGEVPLADVSTGVSQPSDVAEVPSTPERDPAPSKITPELSVEESTVYLKIKVGDRVVATGSGFVVEVRDDTVLLVTRGRVALPDLSDLPEGIALASATPEIEAVFRSGKGPPYEQAVSARVMAADLAVGPDRDLAVLVARGVRRPPRPLSPRQALVPTEGTRYVGGGFPSGDLLRRPPDNPGDPPIVLTRGSVSARRRDAHGRIALLQLDGPIAPGRDGGPIVDGGTGALLGVAAAGPAGVDSVGFVIPAERLRRALDGRVGGLTLRLASAQRGAAELDVRAQLIDPKKCLRGVFVYIAAAEAAGTVVPNTDGTFPPLPNARPFELERNPREPVATGRVRVALGDPDSRRVVVQAAHRNDVGRLVCEEPRQYDLPERPALVFDDARMERLKAEGRRSLARLGPLMDPAGDCQLRVDGESPGATISVPPGVHTPSPEVRTRNGRPLYNAPRAMAEVRGDFVALVRVGGDFDPGVDLAYVPRGVRVPLAITFQGAGLVLHADRDNFIRLERCRGTAGAAGLVHRLLIEVVRNGKEAMPPIYLNVPDHEITLLMVRLGGRIRCLFSPDPRMIVAFEEFSIDFPDQIQVGLAAANLSKRAFDASFQDFVLIDRPSAIDALLGE